LPYLAIKSVKNDIIPVAYSVEHIKCHPNFQVPNTRIGILRIRNHAPVPRGTILLSTIATPVNPPGAILLGSLKMAVPMP
jgi:hypothetical protein